MFCKYSIRHKIAARTYRMLISELDIKIPTLDPMKCIVKVANKAVLNEKTTRQTFNIMSNLTNKEISAGKNPMGFAATVLYMSCVKTGEHRTQKEVAQAAGITDVTLRNITDGLDDRRENNR